MRIFFALLLGFALITPAHAEIVTSTSGASSASQAYVNSAAAAAQAAAIAAAPVPCGTIPASDTLNGSVGIGNCYTRPTDTRPTVVQAVSVTTDSNGNWSVTWSKAFSSSAYFVNPQPGYPVTPAQPYLCNFNTATQTPTYVQGKCWQTSQTTLPAVALSLLNFVVNPTAAAVNISVRIAARDTTQ